ncbi:hypothetical protein OC842_007642, partial [Tilletia horrida]
MQQLAKASRALDTAIKNLYKEAEDAGIEIDLTATVLQRVYKFQLLAAQALPPPRTSSTRQIGRTAPSSSAAVIGSR